MILKEWWNSLSSMITEKHMMSFATATLIVVVGFFLAGRVRKAIGRTKKLEVQQRMLLEKVAYYGIAILTVTAALDSLGFNLKVLLGAAGVLTVAVGFAAQTSASNLISGLFLMIERPFVVGNTIAVGDLRGDVIAIDLLSTKIRTFNNLMVRIPNETLVKSNIINYSYFPIRRIDLLVGVAYGTDLSHVEATLRSTLAGHPLALRSPIPEVFMKGFGDSSIDFEILVWTQVESVMSVRSELYKAINAAFEANAISIPFPTRVLINPNGAGVAQAEI